MERYPAWTLFLKGKKYTQEYQKMSVCLNLGFYIENNYASSIT